MSGGSYNYLFMNRELEDLALSRLGDLIEMSDRLSGLDEREFPGATAAAARTNALLENLRIWRAHTSASTDLLADVWQAVEWWDSGDYGADQVAAALAAYVRGPEPPADEPPLVVEEPLSLRVDPHRLTP